jgi:hypothetical protein
VRSEDMTLNLSLIGFQPEISWDSVDFCLGTDAPAWSHLHEEDELNSGSSWPLDREVGRMKRKRRVPAGPQGRGSWASTGLRMKNMKGEKGLSQLGSYQSSSPWPIEK